MENLNIDISPISLLPDEIIASILLYAPLPDVVNFGISCKRHYELISSSNYLWKRKYVEILPGDFQKVVSKNNDDINWYHELKQYYQHKNAIISELLSMSPKLYWKSTEVSLQDIKPLFELATKTYISLYYTVYILQDLATKIQKCVDNEICIKPVYTLTVLHYAKIVLRYLMHSWLSIKWARQHKHQGLTPEVVVNFFVQWLDPTHMYTDEQVEDKIQQIVLEVKKVLKDESGKGVKSAQRQPTQTQVLQAISDVIYKRSQLTLTPDVDLNTLNLVKVINTRHGCIIAVGTIYQAVARRFGLQCELNAFPNHFFVEWVCTDGAGARAYTVDLSTGELKPKKQCPFSQRPSLATSKYHPDNLLQFMYTAYVHTWGHVQDWEYRNATLLIDFFATQDSSDNPYANFFAFLTGPDALAALDAPVDVKCMSSGHRGLMSALSSVNGSLSPRPTTYNKVVKKRECYLKYAVGMVCYHVEYYYMCVVRGWHLDTAHVDESLPADRPLYVVTAEDQSQRYVPQEKLKHLSRPQRMRSVEHQIGKQFTHFDGFCYVGNEQSAEEYPHEGGVLDEYRIRCFPQ